MLNIKGLVVAPFTAFKEDGALDLERVAAQQQYYKDNNITGVFACGTTGEGSALTSAEKKALLKEWCKYRDDNFAIIAFLGGTSTRECIEVAEYARECGADAVAMTAPYYQKAANVRDLVLTLAEVASKVPDMPFFYYHIPCLTNVNYSMFELLKEMDAIILMSAGLWAVETAANDLDRFLRMTNQRNKAKSGIRFIKGCARGFKDKYSAEQTIRIANCIRDIQIMVNCAGEHVADDSFVYSRKAMMLIAQQAMQTCSAECHKNRKQSKNCPLRKAFLQIPGLPESAEMNPFADDQHCLFNSFLMEVDEE